MKFTLLANYMNEIDFENTLSFGFAQISLVFRNILEKAMGEIGLHSGQIFLLMALWKNDGQSQIELVKNLALSAPTVNKMVKSLLTGGFIECRKCGSDGRLLRVFLTEKGVQSQALVAGQWNKIEARCYANLTETERLIFAQLLVKLKESLSRASFPSVN